MAETSGLVAERTQPARREANGGGAVTAAKPAPAELTPGRKRGPRKGLLLAAAVVLLGAIVGGTWWYLGLGRESTDDAFVDGDVAGLAPRVGGTVLRVLVDDNQAVRAGQVLVEIDPRDYQV